MLDDLQLISQRDSQDALGLTAMQWQQLVYEYDIDHIDCAPEQIVFAGMGGSALSALLAQTWPHVSIPFDIRRDYTIPPYVCQKTLFIASSYSGNTEETIEALSHAEEKGAFIVVIAGGGRLLEIARAKQYPYIILPHVTQPRFATLYSFKALITILEKVGLLGSDTTDATLRGASDLLKQEALALRPEVATSDNYAKQLAEKIAGTSVVIYGGPLTYPAAYKWKISFNENAKNVAWVNQYPEFNHNEFMGWTSHPVDKPYTIINLLSTYEHPQVRKRFELSARLLRGHCPEPIYVEAQGENVLEQMMWLVQLGDFVSLYTALLNEIDPTPVDLVETFKRELA